VKIVLAFEVHQPTRIRGDFLWGEKIWTKPEGTLRDFYFDRKLDSDIFVRASRKAYLPSNRIILEKLDEQKRDPRGLRVAFGVSGTFLEQAEAYMPDLLESFRQLASTGRVEFMEETYYHSLSSLYEDQEEFKEQVAMHREKLRDLLGAQPTFFENTELIYNDQVAQRVASMGYKGMFTEGAERVLGWRSPNYVYSSRGQPKLRLLFRNYRLSDDIAFRFSARWWSEWPLTADKYSSWLASQEGQYVGLFMDYETFGEHHWPETGIHDFLRALPDEVLKHEGLGFATPSEVVDSEAPADEVSVDPSSTISWADMERDTSCWLGNAMQWAYFLTIQRLGRELYGAEGELRQVWRYFQLSDIPYYMYTYGGGPGEVHSYFSPYSTPYDAGVTALAAVWDFEKRVRSEIGAVDHPFVFAREGRSVGKYAYTVQGLAKGVREVGDDCLMEHASKADLSRWLGLEVGDLELSRHVKALEERGDLEGIRQILQRAAQGHKRI